MRLWPEGWDKAHSCTPAPDAPTIGGLYDGSPAGYQSTPDVKDLPARTLGGYTVGAVVVGEGAFTTPARGA